jgi:hypothetical protein
LIRYSLRCDKDHEFEAWFRSSVEYDRLEAAGANACPLCASTSTGKALMAPSVARSDKGTPAKSEPVQLAATPDPKQKAMLAAIKELRRQVTEHADYVGHRFADEARKIHYNEVEARSIYGEATSEDAQKLAEEGIDFAPLPPMPEERN